MDNDFLPYGECIQWNSKLIWLSLISKFTIFASLQWIGFNVLRAARSKGPVAAPGIYWMFACLFGVLGFDYLMSVVVVFVPWFELRMVVLLGLTVMVALTAIAYKPIVDYIVQLQQRLEYVEGENERLRRRDDDG